MPLQFHPEVRQTFESLASVLSSQPKPAINDVQSRRTTTAAGLAAMTNVYPDSPDIEETIHYAEGLDGHQIPVHVFAKPNNGSPATAAILHFHGGGMIMGTVTMFKRVVAYSAQSTGIPHFSVDYRLAPENNGTGLVDEGFAALLWLSKNADQFNIDPKRIAVMGESAGGGIAAGVALMARDKSFQPPIAKQILIYPMLDDCNTKPIKALEPLAWLWNVEDNITAWNALLGKAKAGDAEADVSEYSAPARAKSLANLPSTYVDVGGLDIFRDEDIEYVKRLAEENIEVEFHLYPGLVHGFEMLTYNADVTKKAEENRRKAMLSI